ncbi:MAG: hypothetical protein J6M23_06955 [Bacteroidales bacterium]|nr:hypothetical protein [Bacteroidales bacterium]
MGVCVLVVEDSQGIDVGVFLVFSPLLCRSRTALPSITSKWSLPSSVAELFGYPKRIDGSFAAFCAKTFSSYNYHPGSLAAARMHAFILRLFLEKQTSGPSPQDEIPESLRETFREVGEQAIRDTLSSEHPSGMKCCRAYVRNWCQYQSEGRML